MNDDEIGFPDWALVALICLSFGVLIGLGWWLTAT